MQGDIRDAANLSACAREAKAVFHLAAQVAVTGGALIKSITKFADGPEGMRKAVRELIERDAAGIEIHTAPTQTT